MTNPKRLYETERKRQQRARLAEGRVHKVSVYLTGPELESITSGWAHTEEPSEAIRMLIQATDARLIVTPRQTPPTQR